MNFTTHIIGATDESASDRIKADTIVEQMRGLNMQQSAMPMGNGSYSAEQLHKLEIIQQLRSIGNEAIPALIHTLNDQDVQMRRNSELVLSLLATAYDGEPKMDIKGAIPALIKATEDSDKDVRAWAAETLGAVGPDAKAAVPALIKLLNDPYEGCRNDSCFALGKIGPSAIDALPALRNALKDPSKDVRRFAQGAIDEILNQVSYKPKEFQLYKWGKSEGGLKIGVSKKNITEGVEYPFNLIIEIQNVSLSKITINLGMSVANGRYQYPFGIHLLLKGPNGKVQVLDYFGPAGLVPAGIAGRVDPFLVSLPGGATYTLNCNIKDFSPLSPGQYKLSVQFDGNDGATTSQLDRYLANNARPFSPHLNMLALTPHWIGVIQSGEISVSVNRRVPVFTE